MNQKFYAVARDIETENNIVINAGKFHANCYSYSSSVWTIHYLLRQKPHHVAWRGYKENIYHALQNDLRIKEMQEFNLNLSKRAHRYFCYEETPSYLGYLVNHTKKIAIDLCYYWQSSAFYYDFGKIACVDPIPVLTETGGGSKRLASIGINLEISGIMSGSWCGDLLQIVDEVPSKYIQMILSFGNLQRDMTKNHTYCTM